MSPAPGPETTARRFKETCYCAIHGAHGLHRLSDAVVAQELDRQTRTRGGAMTGPTETRGLGEMKAFVAGCFAHARNPDRLVVEDAWHAYRKITEDSDPLWLASHEASVQVTDALAKSGVFMVRPRVREVLREVARLLGGPAPAPESSEARGIRFRVEAACDGYANLMDSDVPDDVYDVIAYQQGSHAAAEAIRAALRGER